MSIIRSVIARFGVFVVLFLFASLAVAFGFPWVFEFIEGTARVPLPFEGALRVALLGVHALLLMVTGAWVLVRGKRIHIMIWWSFAVSFFILTGIFVGDKQHRLLEEFSWIRYSTSAFLLFASISAGALCVRTIRSSGFSRAAFWLVLALGFLYGGLDEVLQIHEAIGRGVQKLFSYSGEVTDYVTVGYAVAALFVIASLIRARLGEFFTRYRMSAYLFLSGAGVYILSTLLDTVDVFVYAKLRAFANAFTVDPRFIMSDAWYILWSVKNSLNGLEEVFEHTAALLFLLALSVVLSDKFFVQGHVRTVRPWRKKAGFGILAVSILGTSILIVLSTPFTFPSSPVVTKGVGATQIANRSDGLFHADDLAYHPSQGVIIANEGGGALYRFKDGTFSKIRDSKKIVGDPDSVAANEDGVFVSDGNAGRIVKFDQGKASIIAERKDGLAHPEGIVAAGNNFFIIDESQKTLSRLMPGGKVESWKPSHPDWQAPEGISYDASSDRLIVTDDVTGAIFRVAFGKAIEKIAELPAPEDIQVLDDGSMLVTDTAWGAVFRIYPDGKKEKIVQFARMYRDTQGVTVDEQGRLYIITADGFASTSFMPSFLFRIDDIL